MPSSELYADGGVCGKNGQAQAGTWAWCLVGNNEIVRSCSGFVVVEDVAPYTHVSNNITELMALVYGLEAMEPGWDGHVFSDSLNALRRVFSPGPMTNVPGWLKARAGRCLKHLGVRPKYTLLGGHPERYSAEEQAKMMREDGTPMSVWNVWCDHQCNQMKKEAEKYMASKKPPILPGTRALTIEGEMALAATTAEEKHVKGEESPNIRKKEPELFDLIRADLAKMIVESDPLFFKTLSDEDKWRVAHVRARRDFGMVLECVARNHAHITRAYPKYLRELIELATEREPKRMKELDAKHGISEEIAAADRGESPTAAESLQSQLSRTYKGEKSVGREVSAGLFSDL